MKKYFYYFLALSLFLVSCGDDDAITDNVQMNFQLEFEDEPLVMFEDVTYVTGEKMRFSRVSFFISDVAVTGDDGTTTVIREADYIDLTNSHADVVSAENGLDYSIEDLELDAYTSLSFNIGLTADQNTTVPADHSSDNILSRSAEFWSSWGSYVFVKLEGEIDKDNNGVYDAGETFSLHMGTDAVMRDISFNSNSGEKLNISLDLMTVFNNNGVTYDLINKPMIHTLTPETMISLDLLAGNLISGMEKK